METKHKKVLDAINFIVENPDRDNYVSKYFRQFMTSGEYDDNSITLSDQWDKQYEMVWNFLKAAQWQTNMELDNGDIPHNVDIHYYMRRGNKRYFRGENIKVVITVDNSK